MPKRSRKKKSAPRRATGQDVNQVAASILLLATGQPMPEKNPAAVALGRLGGKKGGKARAERLSPERLHEIASAAARARWAKAREN